MVESDYYRHKYFLKSIGIKSSFIYNFLQSLSNDELKIKNEMKLFCINYFLYWRLLLVTKYFDHEFIDRWRNA